MTLQAPSHSTTVGNYCLNHFEEVTSSNTNVVGLNRDRKPILSFISSVWNVTGGKYGLTCSAPQNSTIVDDYQLCKNVSIPDCSDRTVYCIPPPASLTKGTISVKTNPSLVYKKAPGKTNVIPLLPRKNIGIKKFFFPMSP